MAKGAVTSVQSEVIHAAMGKGLYCVLDREEVSQGLKSTLFYRPLADTLTFGLYSYFSNDSPS